MGLLCGGGDLGSGMILKENTDRKDEYTVDMVTEKAMKLLVVVHRGGIEKNGGFFACAAANCKEKS